MKITTLKVIPTVDESGRANGRVIPVWHIDEGTPISQVYVTTILPGCSKGPHLHRRRAGAFTCLRGDIAIVTRHGEEYREDRCGETYGFKTVHVDPGTTALLVNLGSVEAIVINSPNPPWRHDDQDEHPVEDWTYEVKR